MPTHCGKKDSKGYYCQWGSHGAHYYYTKGNKASMAGARAKADKQGRAARASGYGQKAEDRHSRVQSLRFDKEKFSRSEAVSWAKSHGFKYNDVEETENQFRLRQFDPDKCLRSGGMTELTSGVSIYVCPVKTNKSESEVIDLRIQIEKLEDVLNKIT